MRRGSRGLEQEGMRLGSWGHGAGDRVRQGAMAGFEQTRAGPDMCELCPVVPSAHFTDEETEAEKVGSHPSLPPSEGVTLHPSTVSLLSPCAFTSPSVALLFGVSLPQLECKLHGSRDCGPWTAPGT